MPFSRFLNPLEDHPLELAVDALEWKSRPTGFSVHTASDAAYAFVANATAAWNASLAITAAQAAQQWQQFGLFILAEQAIISLDSTFQNDIIKYDVCNATDWTHAQANLFLAQKWAQTAVQVFLDAVSSPTTPAADAIKRSLAWIEGAFAANGGNGCAKWIEASD